MSKVDLLRAKRALADSQNATFTMQHSDYSVDWRFMYIVSVTTLRAVGHVLHKVDCRNFSEISGSVDARSLRWKRGEGDDDLFVHFIEDARNVLLKTYGLTSDDSIVFDEDELTSNDVDIDRVMHGHFEGQDVIGLLQASHRWWERELTEIAELIECTESVDR